MGKIIILGSEKGGVAKTTSTYNLAYCLVKEGKKVLAVDFDALCRIRHNASYTEKIVIPKFLYFTGKTVITVKTSE